MSLRADGPTSFIHAPAGQGRGSNPAPGTNGEPASRAGFGFSVLPSFGSSMTDERKKKARVPPRWIVFSAWYVHRALYRVTSGRFGLWLPKDKRWGTMRLTTTGRRSGRERSVILGYVEDGPNLVTMAMNGWADGEPAWWLNFQANPIAHVELANGKRTVRGRAAQGEERSRLWAMWRELDEKLDDYAAMRSGETAVVILEPREG